MTDAFDLNDRNGFAGLLEYHSQGEPSSEPQAEPTREDIVAALELLSEATLKVAALLGGRAPTAVQRAPERPRRSRKPSVRRLHEHDLEDFDLCRVKIWASLPGNAWAGKFSGPNGSLGLARRLLAVYRSCGITQGAGNWPDDQLYRVGDIRAVASRDIVSENAITTCRWFALERYHDLKEAAAAGNFTIVSGGKRNPPTPQG